MVSFEKAYAVISMWIGGTIAVKCEVVAVDDKPYGWVFYYVGQDVEGAVIFDRISAEIIPIEETETVEQIIEQYESRLTKAHMTQSPEISGFVNF